nr:hypothetical protein [Salsuginibacillus kocurii]
MARKCGLSRNTVYAYLEKQFDETVEWVKTLKTRTKKVIPVSIIYIGLVKGTS